MAGRARREKGGPENLVCHCGFWPVFLPSYYAGGWRKRNSSAVDARKNQRHWISRLVFRGTALHSVPPDDNFCWQIDPGLTQIFFVIPQKFPFSIILLLLDPSTSTANLLHCQVMGFIPQRL